MKTTTDMKLVPLEKLVPYINNARTHSAEQIKKLRSSLREFGFINPVIIDKDYGIIAGHGRVLAAKEEGITEVPCVLVDYLTEAQKKAYIIADNRFALDAGWDEELLRVEIESLQGADFDLALTGFDEKELAALFVSDDGEATDDDFDVDAELEKPCISRAGDVWVLGEHRLVCGDSTLPETYDVLMEGKKANLCVTDPPYNVNYEGSAGKIKNDNMASEKFYQFLLAAFTNIEGVLADDASIYVFHADTEGLNFRRAFADAGFYLSGTCIWKKQSLVLGRSPYQWQHEPVLFGWKNKGKHQWYTGRKESTIWEFDKPKKNGDHPTMKPIPLVAYPIKNSSMTNSIVLDPFGGSGTNTKKRDEFNRMIDECMAGNIDMIITKSISRFARNTLDCLQYIRQLKDKNIPVYFEKESINTMDAKGEVLMTIMAALAQQESESLSANVRLGIQFRNQQGKVRVNHNRFLGYTKDEEGKLVIVPEEAAVVRRIYSEYMDGASFLHIKRGLESDGILNGAHNARWHESNIRQILTNEKYIGDALLQKTYTVSILEKKRSVNNGNLPKYYVEGSHEAIIDKDVFLRVQAEIARRANILSGGKKRVYSGRYALSSIVFCGHCGDIYRRIKWNNHGCKSTVWRCVSRVEKKKSGIDCPARTIKEEELQAAVVTAANDAWSKKDAVLSVLSKNICLVLSGGIDDKVTEIDGIIKEKQIELLNAGNDESKIDSIGDEIMRLRDERQNLLTKAAMKQELQNRIEDMTAFLGSQTETIMEYSDALVRRLVEKITIYDEKLTVEFKSGFSIEVDA